MSDERVERLARAIADYEHGYGWLESVKRMGDSGKGTVQYYQRKAEAVLAALDDASALEAVGQGVALEAMDRVMNGVYRERNQVVAVLSKVFPAWIGPVDDQEPGWTSAVYIDLPTGQVSWHIPDHEVQELFGHLPVDGGEPWDGHTTDEKYARLAALGEGPPLEVVLRGWAVLQLVGKQDGSAWNAYVEEAAGDGRYADGTGPTIDAAIRAAIANAKEHG